jgi:hypothetical protein
MQVLREENAKPQPGTVYVKEKAKFKGQKQSFSGVDILYKHKNSPKSKNYSQQM